MLPLSKLVNLYMHYLSLAALTGASLLSRHYVLTESHDLDKDPNRFTSTSASESPPSNTPLPSIINFSPQYALKFVREFRYEFHQTCYYVATLLLL